MEGSFPASSFHPPVLARTTARYAPWALLDTKAYFAAVENATTAEAVTSTGKAVKVTFCLADPPGVSHFCVHGADFQRDDFTAEPQVLSSSKDLVLLRFAFTVGPRSTHTDPSLAEYFVYKAGRGKPPSLTPILHTPPGTINSLHICVLPFDDDDGDGDGESFLLADLRMTSPRSDYELHAFSSKTGRWTTTPLHIPLQQGRLCVYTEDLPSHLHKVIALGGGAVGWVDLWRGILTCNVLDDHPVLTFIPLPILEANPKREGEPRFVRDIACCNGFIRFVELDLRAKVVNVHQNKTRKKTKDLDTTDIIYDSDLLFYINESKTLVDDGWMLRTCYRHTDWDYWRKGHSVDIDEISADNPHLLVPKVFPVPVLWDAEAGRSTLRKLHCMYYPVMGVDGDDVVYLKSQLKYTGSDAWMIGIDLRKKTVVQAPVVPVSSERVLSAKPDLLTCEFSEYLNATPSARAEDQVTRAPNGTQKYRVSSDNIAQNNLPPQQNMWNRGYYYNGCYYGYADGAHPSNSYINYQHPAPWPADLAQPQYSNFTSSGSGCAYPANAQQTYSGVYTDAGGQLWVLLSLGSAPPLYPLTPLAQLHLEAADQIHHPGY